MSEHAERLPLDDAPPPRAVRKRVESALAEGRLVCIPTETVYGIAARADDPSALDALRALKGRDAEVPLTWHVASRDAVDRFEHLRPLAARLAERYWPGPLTMVLEGVPDGLGAAASGDGTTGVRLPAHRGTQGILAALPFPVVATSVNKSGQPPLSDPARIAEEFGHGLALILDGGPPRLGEPSTVVRIGRGRFDVLREGLITGAELRETAGLRIGFCCTGNTCRSPMAEGIARLELARRLGLEPKAAGDDAALAAFGFEVSSMGVAAGFGAPPSEHAVSVLADEGYDLSRHESSQATDDAVARLDRVYCLTPSHRDALVSFLPPGKARHVELLDPRGDGIPDPIGGPRAVYAECMAVIRRAIEERASDWA